jgi:hypothetical protein
MRAFISLAFVVVTSACALEAGGEADEVEPADLRDNIAEQGLIDCTEHADTGYTSGDPFTISVVTVDGKPAEVDTANAYWVMQQAAAAEGVELRIVSGFRTMDQQEYLYGCYVNCNCNSCNLAARPGYSNHQSGHALDLNTSDAGVLDWLNRRGGEFGFSRTVPSEAWHWEWWGGGPGGGPCGASPECVADPNFGGCNGTVITHCDETNHVSSGDCGAFGAGCSVEGGTPHCVHPFCMMNLDGGETGTFCADNTKIGTCSLGVYTEGDCAAYGGTCSEAGGATHCVHFLCWTNLDGGEDGSFCLEGNKLGSCALGVYSETACGEGTTCGGEPGQARCVGPEEPAVVDDGQPPADEGDPQIGAQSERPKMKPSVEDGGCAQTSSSGAPLTLAALLAVLARRRRQARTTAALKRAVLLVLVAVAATGCANEVAPDEEEPFDARDNELDQGIYDCSERSDTGYKNGSSFPIKVVTVDGRPVQLDTANAYIAMQAKAKSQGVNIRIVSSNTSTAAT